MTTRFYAADLAAYNAGRLHGAWIDATSAAWHANNDALRSAMAFLKTYGSGFAE